MTDHARIFFSVGEPSGDLHAAKLIQQIRQLRPQTSFLGFGGPHMENAGCELNYELTNLAVVGFVEVLPKLREFFRVADLASHAFETERPDAVVLVDFPGFNWHIAKRARRAGIPVFYYLPPQLWAWGSWRVKKMKRYVDHVLCNLPFEADWYRQHGIAAEYVGHPFFDEIAERKLDTRFIDKWKQAEATQVAVLPGSRSREVHHIWPMQLNVIRELAARYPKTRFLVACLKDSHCLWCERQLSETDRQLNIEFFVGRTSEIIELADCALMKSGSTSLEMMARGTPTVVVYHVSRTLYAIGKYLANVDSISLPNLIAGRTVMPEFLAVGSTGAATERAIAAMDRLIGDEEERLRQKTEMRRLCQQLGDSLMASAAAPKAASPKAASPKAASPKAASPEASIQPPPFRFAPDAGHATVAAGASHRAARRIVQAIATDEGKSRDQMSKVGRPASSSGRQISYPVSKRAA